MSRWAGLQLVALLFAGSWVGADVSGAQGPRTAGTRNVRVEINAAAPHQMMDGFGATTLSLIYQNGAEDKLPPALRDRAMQVLYGDVRLTLGNVAIGVFEPENDNGDPFRLDQAPLEIAGLTAIADKLVAPAKKLGADGLYPGNAINLWRLEWLESIRATDTTRYINEAAEYIVASVLKWRDATGDIPRFHELFNEPALGNTELRGSDSREMIEIIKRAGARLRSAGMTTKFIIPSEFTVAATTKLAREILADPIARQFVGAIGYHPYPYNSGYASMARILAGPGRGRRDDNELMQRRALRDLGRQYNLPVWMTEVSHGDLDPHTMDALRARAIQIHDELAYTDASAFFGMHSMWDGESDVERVGADSSTLEGEDTIVQIHRSPPGLTITGTAYAIGHYARWIQRGAMRVETVVDDSLVMVSAFTDNRRGKAAFVVINNADDPRVVRLHLNGLALSGPLTGEQSFGDERWQELSAIAPESGAGDAYVVTVPAKSVTSLGGRY